MMPFREAGVVQSEMQPQVVEAMNCHVTSARARTPDFHSDGKRVAVQTLREAGNILGDRVAFGVR